jgi:hypothetical protein
VANGIELATAYVSLQVDGSKVDAGVRKSLSGVDAEADRVGKSSGKKMGSGMSAGILGAASKIAGPLAAIFAGIQVGKFFGDTLTEAIEAQKVGAATDAIIKSTGGVAKVSADAVAQLSEALSTKLGVDDELIQSGANLLLTFKNIRNEAGAGNDVFNQATLAAQNLSAAGFGSTESAAKMLGKALNDPAKGLTALGRAGVTFSDAQKELITGMVKSGDVLGAQKIILAEIESQVGGVAEATATTGEKVGVAWDNMKERIGTALLPVLERFGNWFLNEGLPALEAFGSYVSEELWPALRDGWETIRPGLEQAQQIIADAFGGESKSGMEGFSTFLTDTLIPAVSTFVNVWLPVMAQQFAIVVNAVQAAVTAMTAIRDAVTGVVTRVLGLFIRVAEGFQSMLATLGKVPGFGWADTAAKKMQDPIDKLKGIKRGVENLPDGKTITVRVDLSLSKAYQDFRAGERAEFGIVRREHGGPVRAGQPYIVGEKRPELFVPSQNGTIVPRVPESMGENRTYEQPIIVQGDVRTQSVVEFEEEMYHRRRRAVLSAPGR